MAQVTDSNRAYITKNSTINCVDCGGLAYTAMTDFIVGAELSDNEILKPDGDSTSMAAVTACEGCEGTQLATDILDAEKWDMVR